MNGLLKNGFRQIFCDRSSIVDWGIVDKKAMKEIQIWISNNIDLIEDKWKSNNMGGEFKKL